MKYLLAILLSTLAWAGSIDDAIADVRKEIAAARAELAKSRENHAEDRQAIQQQISEAEQTLQQNQAKLADLHDEERQLLDSIDTDELTRQRLNAQLERAHESTVESRKEAEAMVAAIRPVRDQFNTVDATDDETAKTKALAAVYLDTISFAATVHRREGEAVLPSGDTASGRLVIAGGMGGVFAGPERVGLIRPKAGSDHFHLNEGVLPEDARTAIRQGGDVIPLDVSGGKALEKLKQNRSFVQFLQAGGPVVIPLLLLAVVALIMVIERAIYLARVDSNVDRLLGKVVPLLETGKFDDAMKESSAGRGPVYSIMRTGIEQGRKSGGKLEEILQESILAELPSLERFLGALAVMAAVAPLLGLLGTVSGMIGTFQVITVYGTGNAKLLSGGISEALITTEIGLVIAVPILLAHAWLNRQVRTIVSHMDRAAISLVSTIRDTKGDGA